MQSLVWLQQFVMLFLTVLILHRIVTFTEHVQYILKNDFINTVKLQ
jgi:hypothetical protein